MKSAPPTEAQDCMALVQWMELKGLRFSHVPQETFTRSRRTKHVNRLMGVRRGVPDYIIIPKPGRLLFVEMKRAGSSPSNVTPEQRDWIEDLQKTPGVRAEICRGYDEAVAVITEEMI